MNRTASLVVVLCVVVAAISLPVVVPMAMAEGPTAREGAAADGVVAFYFHGNVRCATCKKIEAYASEAVTTGFSDQLASGRLAWRVVNVDKPENKHFIEDFQLVTRSVVLAEYSGEKVIRWENLDRAWQLVRSKDSFVEYVQDEAREFLGAS